jgi:hypothetical protein
MKPAPVIRFSRIVLAGVIPALAVLTPLHAFRLASFFISMSPRDSWAPAPITDLVAEPTNEEGRVRLSWTAPTENAGLPVPAPVQGYAIRYATFPATVLAGDTTAWWNAAAEITVAFARQPGETEIFVTPAVLAPAVTYYFAVRAYDDAQPSLHGPLDTRAGTPSQAAAAAVDLPPSMVVNVSAAYTPRDPFIDVSVTWDNLSAADKRLNFRRYAVYRSTRPPNHPQHTRVLVGYSTGTSLTDTYDTSAAKTGALFYWVAGQDMPPHEQMGPLSEPASVVFDLDPPLPPLQLAAAGTDRSVQLTWQASPSADTAHYLVHRGTDPADLRRVAVVFSPATAYRDDRLENGTTYWYTVAAVDGHDNVSTLIAAVAVVPRDAMPPARVFGVRLSRAAGTDGALLQWAPVTRNEDGSTLEDLKGYLIDRSPTHDGPFDFAAFIPKEGPASWVIPAVSTGVLVYRVRAVDTSDNISRTGMLVDSQLVYSIIVPDNQDPRTYVTVQADNAQSLYRETNSRGTDIGLELVRLADQETADAPAVYELRAFRNDDFRTVTDFTFGKPVASVTISEPAAGSPTAVRTMTARSMRRSTGGLAIHWYNGLRWMRVGGTYNPLTRSYSIATARAGAYSLRTANTNTSFAVTGTQPDRTFTPNDDGWNDFFEVLYDNPNNAHVRGKVFNTAGQFVADMTPGLSQNTLRWNGSTATGHPARSGVYIYVITVTGTESTTHSGTCIVAR